MICNDCGTTLVNTARFCASCGSPTYRDPAETQLQRSDTSPLDPDSTDNRGFANRAATGLAPYPVCVYHTNVAAAGGCAGCGHPFCRACMYHYAGRNYCVNCWPRFNAAVQQPQYYQQPYGYGYALNHYYYQPAVQTKSPGLALFLSFIMPGAGQLYNGDIGKGILLFFSFWILVWIFIGWIFWIVAMVDAYQSAQNINLGNRV